MERIKECILPVAKGVAGLLIVGFVGYTIDIQIWKKDRRKLE